MKSKDRNILKASNFFMRGYQDGRSSEAMVKLIESLPEKTVVVCFDSLQGHGQERDRLMAKKIIQAYERLHPDNFLILAGNIHSSIEETFGPV